MLQFDVHPLVLTVQMDMVDKRKLPLVIVCAFSSKSSTCLAALRSWLIIRVLCASTVTCSLFLITAVIGYVRFGSLLSSNLLNDVPSSRYLSANISLVTVQICLSTAVSTTALFQHIEHFLEIPRGVHCHSLRYF